MEERIWLILLLVAGLLLWPRVTSAHVGAPYPVLVDHPVGPYVVSVLTDPDVGIGTFILQGTLGPEQPLPADIRVIFSAWPEDGHSDEVAGRAELELMSTGERLVARVPFDSEGPWFVRLTMEGEAGEGEVVFSVQVTPPYPSFFTTLACLLPFVALGGLWLFGALRRRPSATLSTGEDEG